MQHARFRFTCLLAPAALCAGLVACGGNVVVDGAGGGGAAGPDPSSAGPSSGPGTSSVTGSSTGTGAGGGTWESFELPAVDHLSPCAGERFVMFSETYAKWVGAVLCSPTQYKLFLSESKEGPYFEIADESGHGQDHCELVNPTFSIPDDDDITSGGCVTCDISNDFGVPITGEGFHRSTIHEPFAFDSPLGLGLYTPPWYSCGVSIP